MENNITLDNTTQQTMDALSIELDLYFVESFASVMDIYNAEGKKDDRGIMESRRRFSLV